MRIVTVNTIMEFCEYLGLVNLGKIVESDLETEENECDKYKRKIRDAEVLCTVAANADGDCLDLGTSYGRSAYRIATNLQNNFKVYTVNILPEQFDASSGSKVTHLLSKEEIGSYFKNRNIKNVQQIYADTAKWNIPDEINNISVCYVDAAHDTELVYNDSRKIYPRIKNGGFICWHDFNPKLRNKFDWIDSAMRGVEWFVNEYSPDGEIVHLRDSWVGVYRKKVCPRYRVGLVLDREFHESNRWVSATTPYFVNSILQQFECSTISSQAEYEAVLPGVDVILSMEPGWAAPVLDFNRTKAIKDEFNKKSSFILFSDPHKDKWREDYFINNNIDYILAFYDAPTKYHFKKISHERILHFPWFVPDHWITHCKIDCRGQNNIAIFGAQHHDAYSVRNWCRNFPFVENNPFSGVENKVLSGEEYILKLQSYDAAIAAGSEASEYRLTMPKYFEIPAAGALLFAQRTDDLEKLGFRHKENCLFFTQDNFEQIAEEYLNNPEGYLQIRSAGRELIRKRHSLSVRMRDLSECIEKAFVAKKNGKHESELINLALRTGKSKDSAVTAVASVFKSPEAIYLASADRMDLVLANLESLRNLRIKVDIYASVVGGLSGLNYLVNINPEQIVLFDINPDMLKYADMVLDLIRISATPKEFISRVFSRSVDNFLDDFRYHDLSVDNQNEYLLQPVQEQLLSDTLLKLSLSSRNTYNETLKNYLSGQLLDGARNCRRLLPCWPIDRRVPVGGGQAEGYNEEGILEPNTNTFFYGYGWLGSTTAYSHIKNLLLSTPVRLSVVDLIQTDLTSILDLSKNCMIHISNIDDWFMDAWKERLALWESQISKTTGRLIAISSHNGISMIQPDPHMRAYAAIQPYVTGKVVEVTHKIPWGFYEFDRINVTVEQYLANEYLADTTILHILIGEGISRDIFTSVYKRAIARSNKVIIMEHNRLSMDWHNTECLNFVSTDELRKLLGVDNHEPPVSLIDFKDVGGIVDDARNLLFVVGKPTAHQKRIKVLVCYDEEGWAWWHRAHNIKRHVSSNIVVDVLKVAEPFDHEQYDFVLLFESYLYQQISHVPQHKVILGSSTLKSLPGAIEIYQAGHFAGFIVNNLEAFRLVGHLPNVFCCENGVDEELFWFKYPRSDELTACWVGNNRSMNNKGVDIIRDACECAGVKLLLVEQSENIYEGSLLSQEQVRDEVYHNATCYICASEMEGTPNPALEAFACGLPVISTRVGNMPEIIKDGYNGYLVERGVSSIVEAIEKLKHVDLQKMSRNARESVINGWTWKEQVKKYEFMFYNIKQNKQASNSPLVSVIVPTYNRPEMLKDAIQSILDQTFQNFEIIVINDAGQDIFKVVQSFNSPKIRCISHETNKGLAASRNTGIRSAKGKYIAYLDDDDIFYSDHLATLATFLQKTGERVAYTDAARAHQRLDGDCYVTHLREIPYSYDFDYDRILYENFVPVLCFMHEKECFDVCGMLDESFTCLEDWELWLRMSRHFTMHHIKSLTCEYSYRPDGSSMVSGSLTNLMYMTERLYNKHPVESRPAIKELRAEQLQQMLKDRIDAKEKYAAVQFYFDYGNGIREDNYSVFKVKCNQELQTAIIEISNPASLSSIRIDPHCDCAVLELESILLISDTRQLDLISTGKMINNARIVEGNRYYFETDDPQFIFRDIGDCIFPDAQRIVFQARYISLGKEALHAFVNKLVQSTDGKLNKVEELTAQTSSHDETFDEHLGSIKKSQKINGQQSQSCTNTKKDTALLNVYPINSLPVQSSQPGKIAIHLHLYYTDLADELLPYFARMPFDFDLFITVVDVQMVTFVEQKALKLCGNHLVKLNVITVPNRGRDIAALLVPMQKYYKNYDYICHVHSKKSLYSGEEQLDWCKYLFTSLFRDESHIQRIFGLFDAEPKIGQIYSTTFQRMPYWCHSWLSNHGSSYELFKLLKINLDISQYIAYPVGSMLWARSKSLQPFFDLNLTYDNFPPEPTPNDGTICHAIERSFNIAGHLQGYTFAELDIVSEDFTIGEGKKNLWQYWDKNIDQIWKALQQFQQISFDVFDTLLTRPLLLPDHAFLLVQYRVEHELNIQLDFLTVRKQAESFVRQNLPRASDASLTAIYEAFRKITGLGVDAVARIKQIEIDTEIQLSIPREGMLDLVRQLQLAGKQIVFLSDMYLTSDVVAAMFLRHGFDASNIKILISSETGIRKDTGDVWKSFLKYIGDVHVGDNEHSDIQLAVDNGVPVYHVMSSRRLLELAQPRIQLPHHNSLADSVYLGPVIARLFSSPFALHNSRGHLMISDPKEFGYCVFGPLLLYFMTWLLDKSREQGIQHLLFLSREGYLLQQLYEVLAEKTGNTGVAHSYLLCSRRANSVPTLESDRDLMELLEEQYTGSLANLLETRYGIDLNASSESKKISYQILYETKITLPQDLDSIYPYVLMLKNSIYEQAKAERKLYLDYLERMGISKGTKNAVVDIGFAGTIQKFLNRLTGINIPGFYFVTNQKARRNPYVDIMHGCFGNLVSEHDKNNIFDYSLILEAILTAPNGQFVKFEGHGNPIFRESAHTESTWPVVRAAQLGVIEYFQNTIAWFGDTLLLSHKPSTDTAAHLFNWMAVHTEVISPSLRDALRIDDYYVSDRVVNVFNYSRNAMLDFVTPPADVAFATSYLSDPSSEETKLFRTVEEFNHYFESIKYNYEERLLVEKILSNKSIKSQELVCSGYCDCCGKKTHMRSNFGISDATLNHKAYIFNHTAYSNWYGKVILFREHLVCNECGLNNRQRGIFHAIKSMNLHLHQINTYAYEQVTQFYSELSKKSHRIIGSEFLGDDFQRGQYYGGVRHEDATNLSFSNESFNLLIANDVFEHVPTIEKAFMEAHRVLAEGGRLLFSVPFDISSLQTTRRAILDDGQLQHLLEPVYHGNPVSEKGSLVFYDFGWDILDHCANAGFKDAYMLYYYSTTNALMGGGLQFVFVAEK